MKKIIIILLIIPCLTSCISFQNDKPKGKLYKYGGFSKRTSNSALRIDRNLTYEKYFSLNQDVKCISINIDSVKIKKTFPMRRIPITTYFNVEKVIKYRNSKKNEIPIFIPLGKNYNREWRNFSPVRICTRDEAPLSILSTGRYRIRFSILENKSFYYNIKIRSESQIEFIK